VQGSLMTRLQTPDALNVSKPTMTARANRRTALILAFASRGAWGKWHEVRLACTERLDPLDGRMLAR
jgi:hypothetical protein